LQYFDKTKKVDEKEKPAKKDWFKDSASSDEGEGRGGGGQSRKLVVGTHTLVRECAVTTNTLVPR
jgi:hypothetical protein